MRIILRGVPPSLNAFAGRENTWEYRKAKKEWTEAVQWMCKTIPHGPPPDKAMVRIDYYFPDRRRHDADNYCGKLLLDGLTKADVIADDDFAHISLRCMDMWIGQIRARRSLCWRRTNNSADRGAPNAYGQGGRNATGSQ